MLNAPENVISFWISRTHGRLRVNNRLPTDIYRRRIQTVLKYRNDAIRAEKRLLFTGITYNYIRTKPQQRRTPFPLAIRIDEQFPLAFTHAFYFLSSPLSFYFLSSFRCLFTVSFRLIIMHKQYPSSKRRSNAYPLFSHWPNHSTYRHHFSLPSTVLLDLFIGRKFKVLVEHDCKWFLEHTRAFNEIRL